ncbi:MULTISPECIES: hypothetical protein [Paraburkholderia]|nr:hypothetical protein [Paraburkholderia podalyriae]
MRVTMSNAFCVALFGIEPARLHGGLIPRRNPRVTPAMQRVIDSIRAA